MAAEGKEQSFPFEGEEPPFDVERFKQGLRTRELGQQVEYHAQASSTMDISARLLSQGAPHGTLVLAERQTAPQARKQGRTWSSMPRGNLYFSVLLRTTELCWYGLQASAVAVVKACAAAGVVAEVKWPNDVWIGRKKLSGMIMRTEKEPQSDRWSGQLGVGINVNEDMSANPEVSHLAISVSQALGGLRVSRESFLGNYLYELEALLSTQDPKHILEVYRKHSLLKEGSPVLVHEQGFETEGFPATVQGIADDFRLAVIVSNGHDHVSRLLSAEEVSVRPCSL
jgi:biotin-[acetyl-CoA-carboxylase] ligase BirA-like protein